MGAVMRRCKYKERRNLVLVSGPRSSIGLTSEPTRYDSAVGVVPGELSKIVQSDAYNSLQEGVRRAGQG
jgi:hypothetical protein